MSTVADVEQSDLITALIQHLRKELDLNEFTCYETIYPDHLPAVPRGGSYFVTVSPSSGSYPHEEQAAEVLHESSSISVTMWVRTQLDRADEATRMLHDQPRGILYAKKLVLQAMIGKEIPIHKEGAEEGTVSRIYAIDSSQPTPAQYGEEAEAIDLASLTIRFGVDFDWDLA